jgi:hypothetical protein
MSPFWTGPGNAERRLSRPTTIVRIAGPVREAASRSLTLILTATPRGNRFGAGESVLIGRKGGVPGSANGSGSKNATLKGRKLVKKTTLLVVALCALAAMALMPADASALTACWTVAPFGELICLQFDFDASQGQIAFGLDGIYVSNIVCNGTNFIPVQGTWTSVNSGGPFLGGGVNLGSLINFAASGCFIAAQHVVLNPSTFAGSGTNRNVVPAVTSISYVLSSVFLNETMSEVQQSLAAMVPAATAGPASSAGAP